MKNKNNTKLAGRFARGACSMVVATTLLGTAAFSDIKPVNDIRVNQHGYLPEQPKVAVYNGPAGAAWQLKDASGQTLASGTTTAYGFDKASGDNVSHIDFSSYADTAKDLYLVINGEESYPFDISEFTYSAMKEDAMMYFYHQRFGSPVLADLVGEEFAREAGHLMDSNLECDDNLPSDWDTSSHCNYSLDVRGGHQDAGDYGGYVTNGGYYTWLLNYMYEVTPSAFGDGSLLIPENNNGIPDILDEARYELDFIARMQVPQDKSPYPGMIHHKKSWQDWAPFPLVPAMDNGIYWDKPQSKRTIKPVSTSATLNGAAVMAQGARIWKNFPNAESFDGANEPYHETLLKRAEIAWDAALANPALYASTDASMGSGPYNDTNLGDEFYWAAAELWLTTKDDKYREHLLNSEYFAKFNWFDWQLINVAGSLSLILHEDDSDLTDDQKNQLKDALKAYADDTLNTIASEGYLAPIAPREGSPTAGSCAGISDYNYPWGAVGSFMLSNGVQMGAAHLLTGDSKYLNGMTQTMDHVLGTNALDRAYMTGYGENPTTEPHHRFWLKSKGDPVTEFAAAVAIPYPAAAAGGPQNELVEDGTSGPETDGTPCDEPAKSYGDHWNNYSSNEVTVNWNANLAALLTFIDEAKPAPADNVAPQAPQNIDIAATSSSSIQIAWPDAIDNSRIRKYSVYVKAGNGEYALEGSTKFNAFDLVPLFPQTNYCVQIVAEDYAGNISPKSAEACAQTEAPSKYEIFFKPDNSALSGFIGTGAIGMPEPPNAILGKGWYNYKFHGDYHDFQIGFAMPGWGSPERFTSDGTDSGKWRLRRDDFSDDGVIWLTPDKVFHKVPPGEECTNCPPVNQAPNAIATSATVEQNSSVNITLVGNDIDGTVDDWTIANQPSNGSVSLSGNIATYTPNAGYSGTDSFTFFVTDDDEADSANAVVSITVNAPNQAPTADNKTASVNENSSVAVSLSGSDSDGSIASYQIATQPSNGSVNLSGNNATYTPNAGFFGNDSFTYTVTDNVGAVSEPATVTVTVNEVPGELSIAMTSPANNASFVAGSAITLVAAAVSEDAAINQVMFKIDGINFTQVNSAPYEVTWTPTDAKTYSVSARLFTADGELESAPISIVITPFIADNEIPVANNASVSTSEDQSVEITLTGTDSDGSVDAYQVVNGPSNGSVSSTNSETLTYTPNAGFFGNDSFTFTVTDNVGAVSTSATISITVVEVEDPENTPPEAQDITAVLNQDTQKQITLIGTDADGTVASYQIETQPSNGSVTGTGSNRTYTPNAGFVGTDSFTYKVTDNEGAVSPAATVTVTVNAVPSGECQPYTWKERAEINLSVSTCVEIPRDLSGKTLMVWDSDANPSCDFRGTIVSENGSGSVNITSNFAKTIAMTGTKIRFEANNGCQYVKMRTY